MPKRPFILKISGPNGEQRELPRGTLVSVSFDDEQDGGATGCTIETGVDLKGLPTISTGDIVRCFLYHRGTKELRYHGRIVRRALSQNENQTLTFSVEGESSEVGRIMINREIAIPGPPDLATLFTELSKEAVLKRPDLLVNAIMTGVYKTTVEAFRQKFGDVVRDLITASGNRAGWGVRRNPTFPFQAVLSFDRMAQPTDSIGYGRTLMIPAKGISSDDGEKDATDIRNIVYLTGGVPINPNRVPNADFRLIEFADQNYRSLITNPSFEDGGGVVAGWTLSAGAVKKAADSPGQGSAHSGSFMVEFDNQNESLSTNSQAYAAYLRAGATYRVSVFSRLKTGLTSGRLGIDIYWRIADGTEVASETHNFTITDTSWQEFGFYAICPTAFPITGYRLVFLARDAGTPAMVIDDANFYDVSLVVPRFHELRLFSGTIAEVANYTQSTIRHPYRSSYAPEFALRGNDGQFGMRDAMTGHDGGETITFDVSSGQTLRVMVDLISPKTPNGGVYKNPRLLLQVHWRKEDGTATGTPSNYVIAGGDGFAVWNQFQYVTTVPNDAKKALIMLLFKDPPTYSAGEQTALAVPASETGLSRLIVGGFSIRSAGSQPEEVPGRYVGLPALPGIQYEWIPDGPYQTVISCTDVMPLGSAEYRSIEDFGEHPTAEEQDSITTQEEAISFAQAIIYAYGTARLSGTINLEGDTRQFLACGGLRLRGKRGRSITSLMVGIKRSTLKYTGRFSITLAWGIDKDDPYAMLNSFFEKQRKIQGAGAGSGYYGSSGASSGGFTGSTGSPAPTSYWGTGPYSFDDPTLHDNYYPTGGVHVSPTDRTRWDGTRAEVIASRTSGVSGDVFTTLGDRLDSMETTASDPLYAYVNIGNGDPSDPKIIFNSFGEPVVARKLIPR